MKICLERIKAAAMAIVMTGMLMPFASSCAEKVVWSEDPAERLSFSTDTVSFDTVFTALGSSATVFRIYNNNRNALRSDVFLAGDAGSPFRINIDGQSGHAVSDVDIRGGDSLYCFVSVFVNPLDSDSPLLVEDSIRFVLENGAVQYVRLMAYGQDIIVLKGEVVRDGSTKTLTASRPYLIRDSLYVEPGSELVIEKGARLYFHDDASLIVGGRISAAGTPDSMIVMCGDRLDNMLSGIPYDLVAGRWGGVFIRNTSFGNELRSCDIHSGNCGIVVDSSNVEQCKLLLDGCIVHNVKYDALSLNSCRSIVRNSRISNAGAHCVDILGGDHRFDFCTIAGFYPWSVKESALYLCNKSDTTVYPIIRAEFVNCIITGYGSDEVMGFIVDSIPGVSPDLISNYRIEHSLVLTADTTDAHLVCDVWDTDSNQVHAAANFRHASQGDFRFDFRLDSLSRARGMASPSTLCPLDINGVPRPDSLADVGCYQYVPY